MGLADPSRERWDTVPNAVTLVRTVVSVAVAVVALVESSVLLIVVGYAVYWLGDILDGLLARRLHQETRIGAVGDIVCDRLCTIALAAALVSTLPWTLAPVLIFLTQFAVVDLLLSLGFLRWPILSPNYFFVVDRPLYLWNWSPPAKALNTSSVVLVTALFHSALAGAVVASVALVVKSVSLVRLQRVAAYTRLSLPRVR